MPQGPAGLHRAHGPPAGAAAADLIHQLAQCDAEGGLEQAADT